MIRKAIITCAGYGTRFLPITKAVQKEMLPIGNRPVIDFPVSDCVRAGIDEIIFVVREGDTQVHEFYSESTRLRDYLTRMGKSDMYPAVEKLHTQAKFTFITQPASAPYGTATPVKLAQSYVQKEEAFLVLMGDDFVYAKEGESHAQQMITTYEKTKAVGVMSCTERPDDVLHKYGIAETVQKNGFTFVKNVIEKPAPGTAPSNLANISKYVLTPIAFEILAKQEMNVRHKEFQITDTVTTLAATMDFAVCVPKGEYLDCGNPDGWLNANRVVAGK